MSWPGPQDISSVCLSVCLWPTSTRMDTAPGESSPAERGSASYRQDGRSACILRASS